MKLDEWFRRILKYRKTLYVLLILSIVVIFISVALFKPTHVVSDISKQSDETTTTSLPILTLSPRAQVLAEVEISPVVRKPAIIDTSMYGTIDYNEKLIGHVTAWMPGRLDKLYVDYLGDEVAFQQPMAEIYSPELITAQAELFESRKVLDKIKHSEYDLVILSSEKVEKAAREKLKLLGIDEYQIDEMIATETVRDHVCLRSPMQGTVIELAVREGTYVDTGTRLFTIADLSHVWLMCEAFESDLIWIKEGLNVQFNVDTFPGETFSGQIVYIDPFVAGKTRTARVRLDIPNLQRRLKPGMYVNAIQAQIISDPLPLIIPLSAPLITGKRAVVYVVDPTKPGTYEGRTIVLGPKTQDGYIVKCGLQEGEKIVTKGNFLIDAEMQILAKPSMMDPAQKKTCSDNSLGIIIINEDRLKGEGFE